MKAEKMYIQGVCKHCRSRFDLQSVRLLVDFIRTACNPNYRDQDPNEWLVSKIKCHNCGKEIIIRLHIDTHVYADGECLYEGSME